MATSILSQFIANSSFKLYSSDGLSVLSGVSVTRVSARLPGRLLRNMGEDGQPIIDTKIILPVTITITAIANSIDAVSKLNSLLQDINGVYRLYSRGLYFERVTLAGNNFLQSGEVLSATPVTITFNSILRQDEKVPVTAQSGDSDTIIGGIVNTVEQDASEVTSKMQSIISNL